MQWRQTRLRPAVALLVLVLAACTGPDTGTAPQETAQSVASTGAYATTAEAPAGVRTFVIVPEESHASYVANEELFSLAFTKFGLPAGWAKVVGTTQDVAGRFQLDTDRPAAWLGENEFTVRMNTFTTDQDMRDNWIRTNGPRFNDYPEATFKATSIEGAGASRPGDEFGFNLHGNLTIRAITQPATFVVRATLQDETLRGVATTRLLMSRFGIETITFLNTLTVADEIGLEVQFTARPAPAARE
jgi:polyisoprenoid-binding protein YceI